MIRSISIHNFKSYDKTVISLNTLTFLIGANASGKSNALEAIRLMHWLSLGLRLDDIARKIQSGDATIRGRVKDLFRETSKDLVIGCQIDNDEWSELSITLGLENEQLVISNESIRTSDSKKILYEVVDKQKDIDVIQIAYNNFKRGRNKPKIPCINQQAVFYQLETPGRFGKPDEQTRSVIPNTVKSFREQLRDIIFLNPNPDSMRGYSYINDSELSENGSNLSSVIYKICQDKKNKEDLLSFVRSLPEQDITDISFFQTERSEVMLRLHESFGAKERKVDAPLLSDGTLRVLSVAAALLSAPEHALVIIEEVDNGIHPSRAKDLIMQIKTFAKNRHLQTLISSHNPALLDAVPDESLGNVLCCYRDAEQGDSRIVRLADIDRYPELVAYGSLGQLMTNRVLDRFIKDKTTADQRKKQALAWLNALTQEVGQ
ncbi:MAG: AAA family ATPase [Proteobacteria bacterium]|nr:AAA family ATPase [Pseudomonadota bacterium]